MKDNGRRPVVWITWERQRRNREIARALDIPLFQWDDIEARPGRLARYVVGLSRTGRVLWRTRPRVVICQNPSILLAGFLLVVRHIGRFAVVVDAHNAGLRPLEGRSAFLSGVSAWVQRRAALTIVSNAGLAEGVRAKGGIPFVLPDKTPALQAAGSYDVRGTRNVAFICTYAEDEPWREVFEAARLLGPGIVVYATGSPKKVRLGPVLTSVDDPPPAVKGRGRPRRSGLRRRSQAQSPFAAGSTAAASPCGRSSTQLRSSAGAADVPENLVLTGFLPEDRYAALLATVDVVVDLTSREHCLVCGAYEAMACGKPMVLSDHAANRAYFSRGAVYTAHEPKAIAAAIEQALAEADALAGEVRQLRVERSVEWDGLQAELERRIAELAARVDLC